MTTLIRALPEAYLSFASSLQLLNNSEKERIQEAFVPEKLLRSRVNSPEAVHSAQNTAGLAANAAQGAKSNLSCEFCYSQATWYRYRSAKTTAAQDAEKRAQERKKHRPRGSKGNATTTNASETASVVTECAGIASVHSTNPSNMSDLVTDMLWTADIGATSRMAPHQHWLREFSSLFYTSSKSTTLLFTSHLMV